MVTYEDLLRLANVDSTGLKNRYMSSRSSYRNHDWRFEWIVNDVHHRLDGPAIVLAKGWTGDEQHPMESVSVEWRIFGFPIRHEDYILLVKTKDLTEMAFHFVEMLNLSAIEWEISIRRVFQAQHVDFTPVANAIAILRSFK